VSATAAAVSVALAAVSTVVAAESVAGSVEAPPQAANAAIAKIANTFFIWKGFNCLNILLIQKEGKGNLLPLKKTKKLKNLAFWVTFALLKY
jgi:hypothetical protein